MSHNKYIFITHYLILKGQSLYKTYYAQIYTQTEHRQTYIDQNNKHTKM